MFRIEVLEEFNLLFDFNSIHFNSSHQAQKTNS